MAGLLIPVVEDSGLDDKPEKILESFERCVEPVCQGGLLRMARVMIEHLG